MPNFERNVLRFSESSFDRGDVSTVFGYSMYIVGEIFPVFFFRNNSIDDLRELLKALRQIIDDHFEEPEGYKYKNGCSVLWNAKNNNKSEIVNEKSF